MASLLAVVGGFCAGVFARSLLFSAWPTLAFLAFLALAGSASAFLFERRVVLFIALFFISMTAGAARMALADTSAPEAFLRDVGNRVSYDGTVVSDPDDRDASTRVTVSVKSGGASTRMLVVARRTDGLIAGDRVHVSGTLSVPEAFASDGGRIFRYDQYLAKSGVQFLLEFASIRVIREAPWYAITAACSRVKRAFMRGIDATLPEPYASLGSGIVIGGKSGLGAPLEDAFVRTGLVQIIVLSGYNVMLVADWAMKLASVLFARARRRAILSALAGSLALIVFVAIAGFSSTAVRAMLMALIALFARATARTYAAERALLVAIALMVFIAPRTLVFDPGFALSVAATAGLIFFVPIIEPWLSFIKSAFWKEAISTTIAAQVAVLPLLLYFTGNLSFVALPVNIAAMPLVPAAMAASAIAGFAGILFAHAAPFIGIMLALPAYALTYALTALAQTSAALPWAALVIPAFPFVFVVAAYCAFAAFAASKRFSGTVQLRFERKAST